MSVSKTIINLKKYYYPYTPLTTHFKWSYLLQ